MARARNRPVQHNGRDGDARRDGGAAHPELLPCFLEPRVVCPLKSRLAVPLLHRKVEVLLMEPEQRLSRISKLSSILIARDP